MAIHNPVTTQSKDSVSGKSTPDISTNGAKHTLDAFKPSQDYISDLTMDGTAQAIAIATGASRITIFNQGVTTESIRYAFGTSQANAEANLTIAAAAATTGIIIQPYADFSDLCYQLIGIPSLATHVAIANNVASDTQAVQIVQGV